MSFFTEKHLILFEHLFDLKRNASLFQEYNIVIKTIPVV